MKRRLVIPLVVLVVIGLGIGAYLIFRPKRAAAAAAPTATVQIGSIAATVNGAGNVTPHQQASLSFGTSGTVTKVNVQVGDQVKAGQVLAELDTDDLELQLENAQVNLKIAQNKLTQTQSPATPQDIANARAALQAAQANYNKVATGGATQSDIAAARAAVASAQAAYNSAIADAASGNSQLQAAAAALQKAEIALNQAEVNYADAIQKNATDTSALAAYQNAQVDYQQALANYEALAKTANVDSDSKVQQAKAQLDQAQANLDKLLTPVSQDDLTAAQAQVAQAQNNLEKLLAGPDQATLAIAQAGVEQAQIAVKQAQLALQHAQIVAPFDGVITAVNISVGQTAGSGTAAIEIQDLAHLEIVVSEAETDVPSIKLGQTAQVTLDALPNLTLQGKVTQIAPAGVISQGVVTYPVTVSLTNPPTTVKTGMSASVSVVTAEHDNVLVLPNRAVHTQGRQHYVNVLFEGNVIQVPVTVGLSNDTQTEITSGLKEGDTVLLSTPTTTAPRVGGIGGGFGGVVIRGG